MPSYTERTVKGHRVIKWGSGASPESFDVLEENCFKHPIFLQINPVSLLDNGCFREEIIPLCDQVGRQRDSSSMVQAKVPLTSTLHQEREKLYTLLRCFSAEECICEEAIEGGGLRRHFSASFQVEYVEKDSRAQRDKMLHQMFA